MANKRPGHGALPLALWVRTTLRPCKDRRVAVCRVTRNVMNPITLSIALVLGASGITKGAY
jgi:hypothetical protein